MQYKAICAIEDAPDVLIYSYIYYRNILHLHELPIHVYGETSSIQLCNHTQCMALLITSCTSRYAIEDVPAVVIYSYIYYRNILQLHELPIHVYGEISSIQLCNHTQCIIKQHMLMKIQLICWFLVTFTKGIFNTFMNYQHLFMATALPYYFVITLNAGLF